MVMLIYTYIAIILTRCQCYSYLYILFNEKSNYRLTTYDGFSFLPKVAEIFDSAAHA